MIIANWKVPSHIKAMTTVRSGGHSLAPFSSNNLALHVGDSPQVVAENRALLRQRLPCEPLWLEQVHSTIIVDADTSSETSGVPVADGAITEVANRVVAVMTADCLPLLICDNEGKQVAAVHAGWRGLVNGIIEQAIARFNAPGEQLSVWLGPAIGANAFEVGQDVRPSDRFVAARVTNHNDAVVREHLAEFAGDVRLKDSFGVMRSSHKTHLGRYKRRDNKPATMVIDKASVANVLITSVFVKSWFI